MSERSPSSRRCAESIGQQDTCNGRDKTLAGYHIDYTITDTDTDALVQTITVTLGENAGGGGNTGGGSQGRIESGPLIVGTYEVCEAPDGAPIAYLAGHDDVLLDALPRPEPGNGGSSGGGQVQNGDCIVVEVTTGSPEPKFLDQQLEPEGTGSIEVLKTDDGEPAAALADAQFTVEGFADPFTTAADGTFCVDGLELDSDGHRHRDGPTGRLRVADPASQEVTVTVEGMCDEREGGPDATFVNSPTPAAPTPNEGELGWQSDADARGRGAGYGDGRTGRPGSVTGPELPARRLPVVPGLHPDGGSAPVSRRDQRHPQTQAAPEETPGPLRRYPSVPGPSLRRGNTSLATARRQTSPDPVKPPWAWGTKVLDRAIDSARLHQVRADSSRGQSTQEGRSAARAKGLKPMDSRANIWTRRERHPCLLALLFNLVAPVVATVAPQGRTETAVRPQVAAAASDPNHVAFTLEGCRLENGDIHRGHRHV